jgi:protein-tyrosine-phosphatase
MGNYFRSRLAEELALYYAQQYEIDISVNSGGLSDVANSRNVGPIAGVTLEYLANKNITPRNADRMPQNCTVEHLNAADLVVFTDIDEQLEIFKRAFPEFEGEYIGWQARDKPHPISSTTSLIDKNVEELIRGLGKD